MAPRSRSSLLSVAAVAAAGWVASSSCFVSAPGRVQPAARVQDEQQAAVAAAIASAAVLLPEEAWAKDGVWGPLEGKVNSLVHPLIMACLFLVTLRTGFFGLMWRRVRELGDELKDMKATLPAEPEEGYDPAHLELKAKINALDVERKEIIKEKYKDQHYTLSSTLLAGGVFFTAYGVYNTWMRTERLFPGPHVYAGTAIVVLWAIGAALVPAMEKGNTTARNAHIAAATLNCGLFVWQIPTGWEITQKVLNNAKLPLF